MRIRWLVRGAGALIGSAVIASTVVLPAYANTPLVVTDVQTQNVTPTSATITWKTSIPTISEVDWGASTQYGLTVSDSALATKHSVTVESPLLSPGVTYHFITRNDDQNGTVAISNDGSFTAPGTQLQVKVVNHASSQPISGAEVSWNDVTATTDSSGQAILANLPAGNETIVVRHSGVTMAQLEQVLPRAGHAQNITISFDAASESSLNPLFASIVAVLLFVAGMLAAKRMKWLRGILRHTPAIRHPVRWHMETLPDAPHIVARVKPDTSSTTKLGMSVSELHNRFFRRDDD